MDALSEALDLVRIAAVRVGSGTPVPAGECQSHAAFVLVTGGTYWIEIDGLPSGLPLQAGDFVLLPCGTPHAILESVAAAPAGAPQPDGDAASPRAGATMPLMTGVFEFDGTLSHRLTMVLPRVIHVAGADCLDGGWIRNTLEFAAEETGRPRAGSSAVVNRLCEAVFTYAVHTHLATSDTRGNWLKALGDPRIGDAVAAIHSNPEHRWTVRALASRVGMSRSSFAAQFRSAVGEAPLQHLIKCRVDKACQLLAANGVSLAEVATRVGYESDAAFSKVFKRCTGMAPGAYRTRSCERA